MIKPDDILYLVERLTKLFIDSQLNTKNLSILLHENRKRSIFPSYIALLKSLYLATFESTPKWNIPLRNFGELSIMYEGRL